jgi:cytochrome b561
MLSYQGEDGTKREEKWLARFGGLAALAVAWVPTACPATHEATYSCLAKFACNSASQGWHIGAAAGVFVVLVRLCWIFKERAKAKKGTGKWDSNAALRMHFYRSCIALSTAGVGIIVINALEWIQWDTALFWGEVMVLAAFSIAWLTASKLILKEPR